MYAQMLASHVLFRLGRQNLHVWIVLVVFSVSYLGSPRRGLEGQTADYQHSISPFSGRLFSFFFFFFFFKYRNALVPPAIWDASQPVGVLEILS